MSKIALAQTTSTEDFQANLTTAEALVARAAAEGADLLAFPEVFLFVGGRRGKLANAQALDGPVLGRFRELASQHKLILLLGSLHERIPNDPERVYNTSVLIGSGGEMLAHYRKLRLFDVELTGLTLKESHTIAPGRDAPPVVDTSIGRIGLTICFDLRFSELYRDLRLRGAEIVFIPSNFTVPTGSAHWEVLVRARAIEGQFFVAAPAQVGQHNPKYASYGHSMVVDPWGRVLARKEAGKGLVFAELDRALIADVRAQVPMQLSRVQDGGQTVSAKVEAGSESDPVPCPEN